MISWCYVLSDRGERTFRRDQMRHVVHLAVDAKRSSVGLCRESRNDAARMGQIGIGRGEACIDRRDLIGVNGDPPDKSVTARDPAALREPIPILEIRIQGL